LYGGTVSVDGGNGRGTTISVEVPCNRPFSSANHTPSK
jgi:hypothetical protein